MNKAKVAPQVVEAALKSFSDMYRCTKGGTPDLFLYKSVKVGMCIATESKVGGFNFNYQVITEAEDVLAEDVLAAFPCLYGVLKSAPEGGLVVLYRFLNQHDLNSIQDKVRAVSVVMKHLAEAQVETQGQVWSQGQVETQGQVEGQGQVETQGQVEGQVGSQAQVGSQVAGFTQVSLLPEYDNMYYRLNTGGELGCPFIEVRLKALCGTWLSGSVKLIDVAGYELKMDGTDAPELVEEALIATVEDGAVKFTTEGDSKEE